MDKQIATARRPQVIVGTSGWHYTDWNGLFYPAEIKSKAQLSYYAAHFRSVEINSTFYHVPRLSSVTNWANSVPSGFQFVIKMNRFLTHTKRLTSDEQFTEKLQEFLSLLQPLAGKLAAVLIQLPPIMQVANARLEYLAEQVRDAEQRLCMAIPLALECRHASWFTDASYNLMRQYNIATVINDSPQRWPASRAVTADFAYLRFHGSTQLYRSSYSSEDLKDWTSFIFEDCAGCKRVLCYFNNDYNGVAIQNAQALQDLTAV